MRTPLLVTTVLLTIAFAASGADEVGHDEAGQVRELVHGYMATFKRREWAEVTATLHPRFLDLFKERFIANQTKHLQGAEENADDPKLKGLFESVGVKSIVEARKLRSHIFFQRFMHRTDSLPHASHLDRERMIIRRIHVTQDGARFHAEVRVEIVREGVSHTKNRILIIERLGEKHKIVMVDGWPETNKDQ